ncbi:LutC/YkgG family protein [Propionibacteriaceae bacterium Y2011]|uniref:LutC/YkgG family protein n=1 Tax=Microlunatus sp. Y2014 TaxID=3418488 RepID=UPI003B4D3050
MDARDRILAAVRSATHAAVDPEVPRAYRRDVDLSGVDLAALDHEGADGLLELFVERTGDYRAEVQVITAGELPLVLGKVLGERKVRSLVVPADLDNRWLVTTHAKVVRDSPEVTAAQLDEVDAVVTGCAAAVAVTGTIVLDSGAVQGRRLITLVPDLHVCVVPAEVIVGSVPEAVATVEPTRPLTWISGPSATSDIELDRVEGVHGPRQLVVLVVR